MESLRRQSEEVNSLCGLKAMKTIRCFIIFELSVPTIVFANVYLQDV